MAALAAATFIPPNSVISLFGDNVKKVLAAVLFLSACALAQEVRIDPAKALGKGATELGLYVQGGTGLMDRTDHQFFWVGGRFGKVLTQEHLSGFMRGTLQYSAEIYPFVVVTQPTGNAYGGGFTPLLLTWNFTSGKKVAPFIEFGGGTLFTNVDVPANTNNVNFTPQGAIGMHFFTRQNRAVTGAIRYTHVSNAGLSMRNAGINASLQFRLQYTWFR